MKKFGQTTAGGALALFFALAALSACNGGEAATQTATQTTPAPVTTKTTTAPLLTEYVETTEAKREIVTSAETKEGVIALLLKAFAEKDEETLKAFHCGNFDESYDETLNLLCKALDREGVLPDDISEIDLSPDRFEVYRIIAVFENGGEHEDWEAVYTPANGRFVFWFKSFKDYDYVSGTYSAKSIQIMDELKWSTDLSLDDYRSYAESGESFPYYPQFSVGREVYFERIDLSPYLD
ncbi:MAG: hypothetical protein NC084_11245 [Bacteroides sp.]|nr:hypothetical protein [Eubacterium sp.]MCM1419510.1 hypothetical protein [Roseburia sp.]MCM1463265.1 hypothetical protein [Bacteroides sp.]